MSGPAKHKCAFLDRDGVLNVDHGYVHRAADLDFVAGAPTAVARLNARGYRVVVVTNQSGVARDLYSVDDVARFHAAMQGRLAEQDAHIDAFYICPFHADAKISAFRHADHPDRKPNPGMILRAMDDMNIGTDGSFLIGDRDSDMEAARRAGIPGHLFTGGRLDDFVDRILESVTT